MKARDQMLLRMASAKARAKRFETITLYDTNGVPRYYATADGQIFDFQGRAAFHIAGLTCYRADGVPVFHIGDHGWLFDIRSRRPALYCDLEEADALSALTSEPGEEIEREEALREALEEAEED
jgi:hypothetical protein